MLRYTILLLAMAMSFCSKAQITVELMPEIGITSGLLSEKEIYNFYHDGLTQKITETSKTKILLGVGAQVRYKKHWTAQLGFQYQQKDNLWYNYRQRNAFYSDTLNETKRYQFTKWCVPLSAGYTFELGPLLINPMVGARLNYITRANIAITQDYKVTQPGRDSYRSESYDPLLATSWTGRFNQIVFQNSLALNLTYKRFQISSQYHFKLIDYAVMQYPLAPMQDVIDTDNFSNNDFVLSLRYLVPIQ